MAKKIAELTFLSKKSPYWQMDFVVEGERVCQSTKTTDKKQAERIARAEWQAARDRAAERRNAVRRNDMTWEDAAASYLALKGDYALRSADVSRIAWLTREIGAKTYVSQITHPVLVRLVSKKRSESRWGRQGEGKVTEATVHGAVTALVRRILWHARDDREVDLPNEPKFRRLKLTSRARVAELMLDMQAKVMRTAPPHIVDVMNFFLETGFRREAGLLRWDEVFLPEGVMRVVNKGDVVQEIDITPLVREILMRAKGNHPDYVFTFECKRTWVCPRNGKSYVKGKHYQLTGNYLLKQWHEACLRAGIQRLRLHDLRKTHGARIVRETGCIKSASLSLGHASTSMTDKHYSHLMKRDVARRVSQASKITQSRLTVLMQEEAGDGSGSGMHPGG